MVSEWLGPPPEDFHERFVAPERLDLLLVIEREGAIIGDLMVRISDAWSPPQQAAQAQGIQAELGWALRPEETGKGYATEAVEEALRICFEDLGLRRVTAGCFVDNVPSYRLMERIGMRRETHAVKDALHPSGEWMDGYEYALLARGVAPPPPVSQATIGTARHRGALTVADGYDWLAMGWVAQYWASTSSIRAASTSRSSSRPRSRAAAVVGPSDDSTRPVCRELQVVVDPRPVEHLAHALDGPGPAERPDVAEGHRHVATRADFSEGEPRACGGGFGVEGRRSAPRVVRVAAASTPRTSSVQVRVAGRTSTCAGGLCDRQGARGLVPGDRRDRRTRLGAPVVLDEVEPAVRPDGQDSSTCSGSACRRRRPVSRPAAAGRRPAPAPAGSPCGRCSRTCLPPR